MEPTAGTEEEVLVAAELAGPLIVAGRAESLVGCVGNTRVAFETAALWSRSGHEFPPTGITRVLPTAELRSAADGTGDRGHITDIVLEHLATARAENVVLLRDLLATAGTEKAVDGQLEVEEG